jgi:Tfp pilus assembly protein PilO
VSTRSSTVAALKRPPVIISIVIAAVVVILWLFAFFLPQGRKLSTLDSKRQALTDEVAAGNAKVVRLRHTFEHAGQLEAEHAKMEALVPSTPDLFKSTANYTSLLSSTVAGAHMNLTSVTTQSPAATSKALTSIPVTLDVTGSYDQLLTLITDIYAMPRLTEISSVSIKGGGPGTNRFSTLQVILSLETFTTAKPTSGAG